MSPPRAIKARLHPEGVEPGFRSYVLSLLKTSGAIGNPFIALANCAGVSVRSKTFWRLVYNGVALVAPNALSQEYWKYGAFCTAL